MAKFQIFKATKVDTKGRIGLAGPSGSGKTYTSLTIATVLAQGGKICFIDSENRSSEKYADIFEFDILPLEPPYNPATYTAAIEFAEEQGYAVIIVDSLSHAWAGKGGALEMVDSNKSKYRGNSYAAWRDVTPKHYNLVEAMLQSDAHIIACMRSKQEYVQEKDNNNRVSIKKVGMQPIQREGMEYEFDLFIDMDWDHNAIVSKSRMATLADQVFNKPGEEVAQQILDWLTSGEAERPTEVIAEAEVASETAAEALSNGHTQAELLALASEKYEMDGAAVGAALKEAGFTRFDAGKWDEMVAALNGNGSEEAEEVAEEEVVVEAG